jgi:hypothetical protein
VIYLTVLMTTAVRTLSLFLTVWMTAVAAFPPCCWSMTVAHEHQAQEAAAPSAARSHDHHHHGSAEPAAPAEALPVSAVPAHDCDTEGSEAIATPRPARSSIDHRMVIAAPVAFAMPHESSLHPSLIETAPPGTSFDSAFLNPLRV